VTAGLRRCAFIVFVVVLFACGARTELDVDPLGPLGVAAGLRLIAPLSTATVTSQTPTLRWILGAGKDGAQIDLCRDRACSHDVITFTATGTRAVPPKTLQADVWFWRARSTSGGQIGATPSPVWEFWVGARSAPVDTSWGTTLDVNGDGLPDLAVGAPDAASNLGKAYVYLGSATGFSTTPQTTLTGAAIPESPNQGFFGTTVASAGDLNGDGFGDLVVGAMSDGESDPLVYVYFGGPAGISSPQIVLTDHGSGAFQASMAAAGDVNGDGFGDLIVGERTDFDTTADAWVYFGSFDGISASSAAHLVGPVSAGAVAGPVVASAGDLDGDGFGDVFVGADYFLNTSGSSMVYLGSATGPNATPTTLSTGISNVEQSYGDTPPCAVDLDGDGFADLVLRGPTFNGTALIYPGSASGISPLPTTTLTAVVPDDGWAVWLGAADVDGDGFQDLLVGSNGLNLATGGVYVYPGGAAGVASSPAMMIVGPDGQAGYFGTRVSSAGDVDGDGFADVVVGAFRVSADSGRAYLFTGSASGLADSPKATFTPPDSGPVRFGGSVY
jgi:hypothetical protein